MVTRRTFLAQTGLLSASLLWQPDLFAAAHTKKPGLQLYSLRNELPKDVKGTIAKVAKAGYGQVETFGYDAVKGFWGLKPAEFSRLLKDNGLVSPSGHYGLNSYFAGGDLQELKAYMEAARAIGQEYILVPSLNGDAIKTTDDAKKIAGQLNKLAQICKAEGLKTGYHNHRFEWKQLDGASLYDILLEHTDPALVHMEMDIYWVVRAGQDPVALLQQHPGRFKFVHIKDRDRGNAALNTEIGKGDINFHSILPAARKAGVKYMIVEQENFTGIDPFVSIAESAAYLKKIL